MSVDQLLWENSEQCKGKDTPARCVPPIKLDRYSQEDAPDDSFRGVPIAPTVISPRWPVIREDDKVGEKDVNEVDPRQETLGYDKDSKHKMVGCVKDYMFTTKGNNTDGLTFCISEQLSSFKD